jgi:phage terminase large subunit
MEINLSPKYKPLFQLLGSWEVDKTSQLSKVDTVLVSGGRDSGKSWAVTKFVIIACLMYGHRILFTRYTMSSAGNSITAGLKQAIEDMGLEDQFDITSNEFTAKEGKGRIVITGQKTSQGTASAKLKSLSEFSMFLTDESEEVTSYEEWVKTKRSVRSLDVQPISLMIFNPPTRNHFLYKEFYESKVNDDFNGIIGSVMYINTNYLDNIDNMTESNINDYESLRKDYEHYLSLTKQAKLDAPKKLISRYKEYKNVCLGYFRDSSEGVIFDYTLGEFVPSMYEDIYGMDIGFTHPSSIVKVNVDRDRKVIYAKEILYNTGMVSLDIYNQVKHEVGKSRIWVDSASPMAIKELKNLGLNTKAVNKPKIVDSINVILGYELVIDPSSVNLIQELNLYRWSESNKDYPVDDFNHSLDALRYAVTMILGKKINTQRNYKF